MTDHLTDAALALREAGQAFVDAAQDLERLAAELATAETASRVACGRAGIPAPQPPARELAAEVVFSLLGPLRPHVPFVPEESGRRAAEALTRLGSKATD